MMKLRNIMIIFAVVLPSAFVSCNKWLDVSPEDEISAEEMFKKPEGFYNVLNGIYQDMGRPSLYGATMTWKEMEAWGQGYVLDKDQSSHKGLYALSRGDYKHSSVKNLGETIWTNAYKNIARANMFIQYLEQCPDKFFHHGAVEKNVLMGEALAIRAYLHFDILRVFAKDMKTGRNEAFVPFVSVYPSRVNPPMKSDEVMKLIRADLERASKYLADYDLNKDYRNRVIDPGTRFSPSSEPEWGRFYSQRGSHLNYFAIRLLQARVALYDLDYDSAIEYSREIMGYIERGNISMMDSGTIGSNPKMMDETFFAFHFNKLIEVTQDFFKNTALQKLAVEDFSNFKDLDEDKRINMLENQLLQIFREDLNGSNTKYVSALRVSEIFYILAEALVQKFTPASDGMEMAYPEAVAIMNKLLAYRGVAESDRLNDEIKTDKFIDFLIDDSRREFAGSGQVVFMCKRLNRPVHNSYGVDNIVGVGNYVLPIPDSETVNY